MCPAAANVQRVAQPVATPVQPPVPIQWDELHAAVCSVSFMLLLDGLPGDGAAAARTAQVSLPWGERGR